MKNKKVLTVILLAIAGIIVIFIAVYFYFYSQGGKENYVPPDVESAELPLERAEENLKRIGSVIETYYAENLIYPESLQDLTPDYMDEIPKEPLENKHYLYQTDGETSFTVSLPNPSKYELTKLEYENGTINKK